MTQTEHFTAIKTTEPRERDWLAIQGTIGIYLLTVIAIAAALAWNEDRKLRVRQLDIAERNQHVLELYTGVLQKDIDEIRSEVAAARTEQPR